MTVDSSAQLADFSTIRTVSPGDARPALPAGVQFPMPKLRAITIADLQRRMRDHTQAVQDCQMFADTWRDNPLVSDGQWLANLYDQARSQALVLAVQDEINRRREYNRSANEHRPPRRRAD